MESHIKFDVLSGQSVRLEPIDESHIDGLFEAGKTHSDWQYLPIPGFSGIDEVRAWYHQAKKLLDADMHYTYVLIEPASNEIIGSSRYMNVRARDLALEIGYTWIGSKFQRTAINTEAKLLLLTNAFEGMNSNRVELKTDARNTRSQQAIERVGATREGVLRNHMVAQGGFVRDTVMYSIIKSEWPAVKENLTSKLRSYA
ncbi:MAG: GNAT family N-acetyltransferase [Pseudomonadales bacterium]|nr:GNAT family N-acetyltransferase [Pseudomonadales bacterium]